MADPMEETFAEDEEQGAPAWVMTFADLMSLLMCFFVLLLSFSELDVLKFKRLAGSMREAFGVQKMLKVEDIPKGTSVIAQEFTPGRPEPTPLETIRQFTAKEEPNLRTENISVQQEEEALEKVRRDADQIMADLSQEISNQQLEVETVGRKIIIRIKEKGSFPSGSASLTDEYLDVMYNVREAIEGVSGTIAVEGHTDDLPIATQRFRSNWDLSAARAASVAHELMLDETLDPGRFTVTGRADTQPLVPNDSSKNRARNRRVEIVIQQGRDKQAAGQTNAAPAAAEEKLLRIDPFSGE